MVVKGPYCSWHGCCTWEVVAIKRVPECSRCFLVLEAGLRATNPYYIISEEKRNIEDQNKGRKII